MRNKPPYALASVDNALRLIQLLRDQGRLRLVDAADQLGCAPSTAHRLLAMLVYRGFALQDDARGYLPGPALVPPTTSPWPRQLREIAHPHLERLAQVTGETTNLVVRVGTQVRFISSVESKRLLRVGDRQGAVLPARRASGGKVLLAELDPVRLVRLFRSSALPQDDPRMSDDDLSALIAELRVVRARGYAVNNEETEESVIAIGVAIRSAGVAVAAISVSMPVSRHDSDTTPRVVAHLRTAAGDIGRDVEDAAPPDEGLSG